MTKTIALNCASCGSNLDIKPEMNAFACGYCGVSPVVERSGGTVSLHLIGDAIRGVQAGTDRTAAELALKRLGGELETLQNETSLLNKQKSADLDWNLKLFAGLWIGLVIVCILIGAVGRVNVLFCVGYYYRWINWLSYFVK